MIGDVMTLGRRRLAVAELLALCLAGIRSCMRVSLVVLMLAAIGSAGCSDSSAPSATPGELRVAVRTQGNAAADTNGYLVQVDQLPDTIVTTNGTLFLSLPTGSHDVHLGGVAEPCAVVSKAVLQVPVSSGDTASVEFQVDCTLGGVRAVVTTTGLDPDPDGYLLGEDASPGTPIGAGPSDTASVSGLAPGLHTISLGGIAAHCSVQGLPSKDITVVSGEFAQVAFTVECGASYGVIGVSVTISGDGDVAALYAAWEGNAATRLFSGMTVYAEAAIGTHLVSFRSARNNCSVVGADTLSVNVAGGPTRDTVEVDVTVVCLSEPIIRVTVPTTSANPHGAYRVIVSYDTIELGIFDSPPLPAVNDSLTFEGFGSGRYRARLLDIGPNCTVGVANPTPFTRVEYGDTLDVQFPVTCSP